MNNIEREVSSKLREKVRALEKKFGLLEEEIVCYGISMAECHTLVEIGRAGAVSLNQLAEKLSLEKSTVSRKVNDLVEKGFVERKTDPEDRRYILISLAEEGRLLFNKIEQDMNQYYYRVYNCIPEHKRKQVLESLDILLAAVSESDCCEKITKQDLKGGS